MLRTFIQTTAIVLTLEASWFLLVGNLGLGVKTIAELSATKWGYNLDAAKTLAKQNADSWMGFALLLIAFCLQLANSLWEMGWDDFAVNWKGVALALGVGLISFFVCRAISNKIAEEKSAAVAAILKKGKA